MSRSRGRKVSLDVPAGSTLPDFGDVPSRPEIKKRRKSAGRYISEDDYRNRATVADAEVTRAQRLLSPPPPFVHPFFRPNLDKSGR